MSHQDPDFKGCGVLVLTVIALLAFGALVGFVLYRLFESPKEE